MVNFTQLIALEHSLVGTRVLSVYLDGTARDPAKQRMWRVQLDHSVDDLRVWLAGSPHAEREEFEQCLRLLDQELEAFTGNVGAPGWAAFITADRVHEASLLPVAMPTQAVWSTGMSVAPYMRALKEIRPVAVVLVDSKRADVHQYYLGKLEHIDTLRAHHAVMKPSHMGDAPRQGFHPGTRGDTGHDEAQRSLLVGTNRMLADAAECALRVAGAEGWIATGGIPKVSRQLAESLSSRARDRVLNIESLDIHASEADLAEAARVAASTLRNAMDAARIAEITDRGEATGLGALGPAATQQTLDQRRVRELYVTHRYLEDHAAEAEDAVRSAIDQGAVVEEVSGAAAEQLDAHGGMAARLRYRVAYDTTAPSPGTKPSASTPESHVYEQS
jgi:Bacterial archaeo-eukaryotic release factor family 10